MQNIILDAWLKSDKLTDAEKKEIKKLSKLEQQTYFSKEKMHFGTAGVRGIMGVAPLKMNRFTYANLAQAYARYVIKEYGIDKTVVIGHDNRLNSSNFSFLVAGVLSSYQIKVLLFSHNQLMPTPIISYTIRQTKSVGGLIITASHNPKEYNGFKAYHNDGSQVLPNVAKQIEDNLLNNQDILGYVHTIKNGYITYLSNQIIENYFEDAKCVFVNQKMTNTIKEYPIVLTTHHGTASKLLPKFLRSFHFNIKPVAKQCFVNTSFVNSPISNPENIKSFDLAIAYANQIKSNVCIGVDPDADRMAICIKHHNQWRLMSGNEMGILYTYYVLKNRTFSKPPYIISSHVSTNLMDRIAKKYHTHVYRTGTGFKWMGAKITEIGNEQSFVIAFEEAIGALAATINRDKDSFTASALALEIYDIYRMRGMDFVDILEKEIYPQYGFWFGKTVSVEFKSLNWKNLAQKQLTKFKSIHFKKIGPYKLISIKWNKIGDCLEWNLDSDSWIKFRTSGTEPKFKIYYNLYGESLRLVNNSYKKVERIVKKLILTKSR